MAGTDETWPIACTWSAATGDSSRLRRNVVTHTSLETTGPDSSLTASIAETMADKAAREAERNSTEFALLDDQPEEAATIGAAVVSFIRAHPVSAALAAVALGILTAKLVRRR